jgi:hypothetical protein
LEFLEVDYHAAVAAAGAEGCVGVAAGFGLDLGGGVSVGNRGFVNGWGYGLDNWELWSSGECEV